MNRIVIFIFSVMAVIGDLSAKTGHDGEITPIVKPDRTYSYEDMMSDISALKERYSFILTYNNIGKTVEGRKIPAVRLGRGRHNILVCAAFHAREYITTNYVMYFIDKYAQAYAQNDSIGEYDVQHLLDNVSFYIVPMVNPDGVNIVQNGFESSQFKDSLENMLYRNYRKPVHRSWKANARGVDLNRNFDYGWNRKDDNRTPASSGYNGPSPLSEPEAKAVAYFAKRINPEAVLSFHTQGKQLFLSTPDSTAETIADKLLKSTHFSEEPIDEPYGSFQDFVDHHLNVFYACVELCPYIGPVPYHNEKFYEVWQSAQYILPIVATELINKDNPNR